MKVFLRMLKESGFIVFVLVMFILLGAMVAFAQEPKDGYGWIEREQPTKGIEILKSAVDKQPTASNQFHLGMGYLKVGDLKNANMAFDKGLGLDPKSAINQAGKGRVYLEEQNAPQALVHFDKALDLSKSKDIVVLNAIAEGWISKPEFVVKGLDLARKAESINPNFETSLLLGDGYLAQGNGGKAITSYEYAASLDVRSATPYYRIGVVYVRSTNKESARESFEKAASIDPTYAPAWRELAEIYYQTKRGDDAVKAQEKYLALVEQKDAGLSRLGYYQFMAKDFARASESFELAHQKGLLKETGLRYFAIALTEAGEYPEGQKVFEEYFQKVKPAQVEATDYAAYGRLLLKVEQDSLAVRAFNQSLALDGNQVTVRQQKAETLFKSKKYGEAVTAFDELIAVRGKATSQDLYTLGRALYYRQDFRRADSTFRKLVAVQPTMSVGYLWAGRANANLDPESEEGRAKPFYEKVIEFGAANPEKSKSDLKEAYSYLGYYFFVKKDFGQSKSNWEKVLAIDPKDERATEAMKIIKQN